MSYKNLIVIVLTVFFCTFLVQKPIHAQTLTLTTNSSYSDAIQYAYDNKITGLYSDGQFKETSPITRAEIVKMALSAREDIVIIENCLESKFIDVDIFNQFFKYICTAEHRGITGGYEDGTFKPNKIVTIPEAAYIIARIFDKDSVINTSDLDSHVIFLSNHNAIPSNLKCIGDDINRGDVVEMIYRLDNKITHKESTSYDTLKGCPVIYTSPMIDSSCHGFYISRGWSSGHTGLDLVKDSRTGSNGCWISSVARGTIEYAGWSATGLGNIVIIRHPDGFKSMYAHGTTQILVKPGQQVKGGQKIMFMGNTGRASTTHLHFSFSRAENDIVSNYRGRINPIGKVPF